MKIRISGLFHANLLKDWLRLEHPEPNHFILTKIHSGHIDFLLFEGQNPYRGTEHVLVEMAMVIRQYEEGFSSSW
jgi:hypothetical protein